MSEKKDIHSFSERISKGEQIDSFELSPFLAADNLNDRISANVHFAQAYLKMGNTENAAVLIKRAFILSDFSVDLLPLYIDIFKKTNDGEALKFAYKRIGIKLFNSGRIAEALEYFDKWQYAYFHLNNIDRYESDYDIQLTIDSFCENYRKERKPGNDKKIRIGYLPVHFTEPASVLIKLDKLFALHHDKHLFEVTYFVMETESHVHSSAYGRELDKYFRDNGCSLIYMDHDKDPNRYYFNFVNKIRSHKPDLLISNAVLANFDHYFVASFKPAPIAVTVVHGPVAQYATKIFDHTISSFDLQTVDVPCNTTQINIELPEEQDKEEKNLNFDLPKDKVVMICGGRPVKFQNADYWRSIFSSLKKHPQAYLCVVGFGKEKFPFPELLTTEILSAVSFIGWTPNYSELLKDADIYLDGYPVGGGVFMMEAMRAGVAVLGFEHDYLRLFSGAVGSGVQEIVGLKELYSKSGDFEDFEKKISYLIEHNEKRIALGKYCRDKILNERSQPLRMVKRYEEVYVKLIAEKRKQSLSGIPKKQKIEPFEKERGAAVKKYLISSAKKILKKKSS